MLTVNIPSKMVDQSLLRDLTESYLRSIISEASGCSPSTLHSLAPFGELGIDSFRVLKIIKRLEADFGRLPKSLLFENFTINDLANYFVVKHEQSLSAKFTEELGGANSLALGNGPPPNPVEVPEERSRPAANQDNTIAEEAAPIRILEKEAYVHPELRELVRTLFERYKKEGCASRGTRKIAPNLFIGTARRGYFNYGRSKNIILVYAYTGPRDYFHVLMEEMRRYCETNNFQLNFLADEEIEAIGSVPFSSTPFGALQRIVNLQEFKLEGGAMRRLRYQVSKFQRSGACKTEEYRCGSNQQIDQNIGRVIDQWCAARTMVNPLVHDVKSEILAGTLGPEHRLFLTYLDHVLQNVILITGMSSGDNGYLMDLEFYPPEMPLGGLEFAIVQIVGVLVAEGCDVLSMGGTYGCKLRSSANADPEIDKILDSLREQNIFNDGGNLQFKNKFRPENKPIFLCRPVGSADPDNVIDIIMMIADPEKMQTSDEENHNLGKAGHDLAAPVEKPSWHRSTSSECTQANCERLVIEGNDRSHTLSEFGFNPLNIPPELVEFDLKTDSWAQLQMPAIEAHIRRLHAQLQQPADVDESLRAVFPFAHFVLAESGQAAEHIFFKAWPKKGLVLQNLLFPSTIFHQIDKGFTSHELPHPAVFETNSHEPYKGNLNWEELQSRVAQDPAAISFVCIEVNNNAAGGYPVSMQHLRDVRALLAEHSIPLVIDATRVVENARFLIEHEKEYAGKSMWVVVREMLSYADIVIGSLTKDFCVKKGGIVATNDVKLFHGLQALVHEEGVGIDLIDKKMLALSLQHRKQIEANVLGRMEGVRLIWRALNERNLPIAHPAGGHCILIDVKQIPEFKSFDYPVASFLAWMYLTAGIRGAAHSVGMQRNTRINDLVRLALPIGLTRDQVDSVIDRLIHSFDKKVNIPELVMENGVPQPLGGVCARYKLAQYHKVSDSVVSRTVSVRDASGERELVECPPVAASAVSPKSPQGSSSREAPAAESMSRETESSQARVNGKSRRPQDVAIVGMAGRYPKAKNLSELWENLAQGRDCIEDIPANRFEWRLQHGSTEKYRGGFIDDVDKFDSLFFNISPREAEMLDPQERLFLEVAWEAIEDAGYYPEILVAEGQPRNIGVFVGAVWAMYQMLGVEEKHVGNKIVPNSFLWSIANRVSYCLNLSGPSLTVDTACSSSLTAIHLACEAIRAGECSAAIVGGVNLDLHQAKFDINQNGGALSADGVCRSFGKGANGYVGGEGVGALFLKPLDQAVKDGDNIYGVIRSAVVNHGGRTSGYTVPNPRAQTNLILTALEKADVGARSIGYIEAHGTGTELGDPVEIAGLSEAFRRDHEQNQTCAIGSIKTNIGHLEAAAGVVSVSKVLLQMKHQELAPSLHSTELNEFIDFQNSPFYVVQRRQEWKPKEVDGVRLPLRAGVSSFGAGGSNAHIILESYEPIKQASEEPTETRQMIFPLSARSQEQLREAAVRLANFLQQSSVDLRDAAYTLQIGRKSFDHRLTVIAKTRGELLEKLICFVDGKKTEGIATGHAKGGESVTQLLAHREKQEFIRLLSQNRDPHKLSQLWVEGLLGDWHGLQTHERGKRVSLPTYPFADKRHWAFKKSPIRHSSQQASGMHPLVDSNESTFERQLFKKVFHERDFFIYDHHVANIPTLPGVAYLELARKAGEIAAGRPVRKIRNILWVSPIAVQNSTPTEVLTELKPSGDTVQFEVFSKGANGGKVLHSQGKLLYTAKQETATEAEYVDLDAIRRRCEKSIDGKSAYPLFKSFGLNLGPSFQVLQEVHKNDNEVLGVLKLPECRQGELQSMVLHPSLIDGSLQAGVAAQLGDNAGEMVVPYSIGEVEILHPLQSDCFSYVKQATEGKSEKSRVLKSNVLIVDQAGKVLVKIRESTGVPLREVHKKSESDADKDGFSKLYYAYDWEKAPLGKEHSTQNGVASILLFDTRETLRGLYQERLREAGTNSDQLILVQPGENFQDLGEQSYQINPQNKEDFTRLFECLIQKQCSIENICFAWAVGPVDLRDERFVKESLEKGVSPFLYVCQSLIKQKLESKVQLLYLYSAKPDEVQPHNDAVRAFINTLHLEHPKLLCKTLEIRQESADDKRVLDAVLAEFHAHLQDATAVRYDAQERYIKKLKSFAPEEAGRPSPSNATGLRENGVYLITGGAGGLGLIFAGFLAKEYKAKLVLTGRSELPLEREARLEELRKSGAEVLYLSADVSNREQVRHLVSETKSRFGAIHGVFHAAGVLRDSLIRNKTAEEMSAVFAPKVYGTLHLDEVTKDEKLDFFATFSSLAAVAGNAGQCDYSFANHFMDAFVAEREHLRVAGARSGKTLSVNWSIWADGGMKLDQQTELYFKKTLGIRPLSAAAGLEAFVRGLASERSQFAVLEGVQEKVELAWGLRKKKPAPAAPASSAAATPAVMAPSSGRGDGDLQTWLEKELSQIVVELLKLDPSDISADKILLDLGFDSIGLTTFANAINEKYELDITPVLFFDYPSISEIAKHLSSERKDDIARFHRGSATTAGMPATAIKQGAKAGDAENAQEATFQIRKGWDPAALDRDAMPRASGEGFSPELRFVNMPIAIVGMSGVMPQSEDLEEFWDNLKNSKDMITVIPEDRWRWEDYYGDPLKEVNKSNSKWGGFMKEIDKFDPLFFGISPREAQTMDPQQRIFLEHVWKAIEDSGQKVSDLSGTRTGLFVGVATNDYIDVMNNLHTPLDGYSASGNSHSVLANRVSFLLNLRGPSAPIDTACSSSLIALHRAIESIHTGSCDTAIVGGVQVMLSPAAYISFGIAGMLSGDGKCKTFDKRANGYVRGEGCGVVFLKPLSAAEADGNHIYAVIKATAENHGGRVTTLTAPNSSAQSALLIEAYEKGKVDPSTVGYIECHGTGTSLGDPIEIQALSKAFSELYKRHNRAPAKTPHCGLSSVKTNIGHLETGAGIASMLKVLLAIKHKQIPANIHFEEINPYINLKGTPFYIADKLTPWEAARGEDGLPIPRRAGVSSFGFGGANAHVVLEEYIPPRLQSPPPEPGPQLIVLSAKNEERLKAYVQSMHTYLEKENVELADFAYTLQVGRDEMPERLAFVVSSVEDLKHKFAEILNGGEGSKDCYRTKLRNGRGKSQTAGAAQGETPVQALIEGRELSKLAELWVSGTKIDWRLLYHSDIPRRISLPTYPFARERYWIPSEERKVAQEQRNHGGTGASFLHPLVHRNVSTLEEQKFASRFSGEEFYLADHVVETRKILPGVAYLEMARVAGELSGNAKVRVIRNLTWERPLIVGRDAAEVEVSLVPIEDEIKFAVKTAGREKPILHCTGKLTYSLDGSPSDVLDIAGIQDRCFQQVISGSELYPLLSASGLKLGRSFQIVERIYANESEALAVLHLPEHLRDEATQFWLHPALMDGSLHTAVGLMKKNHLDLPLSLPYSVGEVQILHPLQDLHYGYATWAIDDPQNRQDNLKVNFQLLDKTGKVLVRIKDFASRPLPGGATKALLREVGDETDGATGQKESQAHLQTLVPRWNLARVETEKRVVLSESPDILLVGGDQARLDWVRKSYPHAQFLELSSNDSIDIIEKKLGECSFDQLLWVAPDASPDTGGEFQGDELIIDRQEEGVLAVFRIIKALLHLGYANRELQWTIVTVGTQQVTADESIQPAHAGVVGLVGSLAKEYPQWNLRMLDLDSLASVSAQECLSLPWDKQGNGLASRKGEWFQQELQVIAAPAQANAAYRQSGVYVVVGGAGGLGEVWSRFMIENYQASIVWIGRRKYDSAIEGKINSLTRLGRAPLYVSADAADLDALEQARKTILKSYPVIHGVVHSAMVLHDQSIARMEESRFKASLSAKVDISVNIDRVFGKEQLDFMLFFSSIISFFKTPGQSNYSAGSTFKDSFAHKLQRQRAYPVKIVNWGYWGAVGAVADEFHRKIMEQMGIGSIEADEGMASLRTLLGSEMHQLVVVKTLDSQATANLTFSEAIAYYQRRAAKNLARHASADLSRSNFRTIGIGTKDARSANDSSPSVEPSEQMIKDQIRRIITDKLSEALKMDGAMIRGDDPFADYGVDSIAGVNFVRSLADTLQIDLEPAKLFEYSTVNQLCEYICANWQEQIARQRHPGHVMSPKPGEPKAEAPAGQETSSTHRFTTKGRLAEVSDAFMGSQESDSNNASAEPIAIIGMSGRFAESETLEQFWVNLKEGKDLVKKVSRWSARDCVIAESDGHEHCSHGSFIDSIDRFDPSFFRISALEATWMDPQQRLFLEESWKALEDAGYAGKAAHDRQCGVYVGCGTSNYDRLFTEQPPPQAWWGNSQSVAPARIAYYLNLQGPAIAVDTACSSSLVAIHLACQGLWSRETEMALAGGVYVEATPGFHQVANRAGMLSPEGKCYSFDARANGFVPGEGVGVVVLKRLQDALRDGDHVYGVIAGSGINQNGSSNGLIAPNARAQERLERCVYDRFKINPETIQVVEAHGTGTIVGDSIECGALSRVFREYTAKKQFCAIGSVKTNIGHAATAAGVASVLKLLLSLKHRQIPPSLHFEKANPAINFESGPFYVNSQLREWEVEGNQRRRAAVSSFGFSGTNAHLVLEEAPSIEQTGAGAPGYLIVLSARTLEQVQQQARNLLAFVKNTPDLSMNDLSFSLFMGRMHLACRLSCIARNQEELIHLFQQWLEAGTARQIYTAELQEGKIREQVSLKKFGNYCIQECKTATDSASYLENLAAIADLYVQGYSLDFHDLFSRDSRRIPLPTYPFANESYWIAAGGTGSKPMETEPAALHPLLHTNTSNLKELSYSTTFVGSEFFLKDHQLVTDGHAGQKVLHEAAYLEMARVAVEGVAPMCQESSVLELRDIVWGHPIVVAGRTKVTIALLPNDRQQMDYEIYSVEAEREIIHCQGRAFFCDRSAAIRLDIDELQRQMQQGKLAPDKVYAEFVGMGVRYGPAYQAITAIDQGERQLLARLSLPAIVATRADTGHSDYFLHPSLMAGALQSGIRFIVGPMKRAGTPLSPRTLKCLRILSPCTDEMLAWVRDSQDSPPADALINLDIDLIDHDGNVCVQMRGLSFLLRSSGNEPPDQPTWLFSLEQPAVTGSVAARDGALGAAEKMELFLRQETALQLQKPIGQIPINQSYFDLGLNSLGIVHVIQNTNRLLGESLHPNALFEHGTIESLAAYLAEAYPSKVAAVNARRQTTNKGEGNASGVQGRMPWATLVPLPRGGLSSNGVTPALPGQTSSGPSEVEVSTKQILESISRQEASVDGGYERVTF